MSMECKCHCHIPNHDIKKCYDASRCEHCKPETNGSEEWEKEFDKWLGLDTGTWWRKDLDEDHRILVTEYNKDVKSFIRELLSKAKCNHQKTDPACPCFSDGFETADAEECFEKVQEERERILQGVRLEKRKIQENTLFQDTGYNQAVDELEKKIEVCRTNQHINEDTLEKEEKDDESLRK